MKERLFEQGTRPLQTNRPLASRMEDTIVQNECAFTVVQPVGGAGCVWGRALWMVKPPGESARQLGSH